MSEYEEVIIDIIAVIEWDVTIGWLRAPDLRWDIDHKGLRQGGGIRRSGAGDMAVVNIKDRHQALLDVTV